MDNRLFLDLWLIVGLIGQLFFFLRFFVQWIVSEYKRQSTVPDLFWYLSLIGGITLLFYAIHKEDIVFIIGQAGGLIVYIRNIMLLKHRKGYPLE